jgi:myosin heavy subunit
MEAGAHVWCSDIDGDNAWILAEVMNRTESELTLFQIDNPSNIFKRSITLSDKDEGSRKYEGVELANVKLSEQDKQAGRDDDLITLPHLHEPALLHACAERFFSGKIYTWTGPVLIAVNPFQRLPLYTMVSGPRARNLDQ